jgi:MbtH protein
MRTDMAHDFCERKKSCMSSNDQEDTRIYKVVINDEEQYSIWPENRENPIGWRDAGKSGLKDECLNYIKEVWTDMRPLSLRRQMEANS